MADLDPNRIFPNSYMAQAARLGQSRIYSREKAPSTFTATNFDPNAKTANVTLSNNNLTATVGAGGTPSSTRGVVSKSSGKYYVEYTVVAIGSGSYGYGFATGAATPGTGMNQPATTGVACGVGSIWINGTYTGTSIAVTNAGGIICCAIDIGAKLVWYRNAPAGNWNASGTANPATGVGGKDISVLTPPLYPFIGWGAGGSGQISTANFGASAFSGVVPNGFTAGWG